MEDSFESPPTPTEETTTPAAPNNSRVTRSHGQSLAWNTEMNAGNVLLSNGDNEHVNTLHNQEQLLWV